MIKSFGSKATEDIFNGVNSKSARSVPKDVWPVAARKLDMINAATKLEDLRSPPANELEKLKGDLAGFYSIRVNKQWRVIFKFERGVADEVEIVDYH